MRAHYDPEADAMSIRWGDAEYGESDEVDGVILDYDKEGNVIGVEILGASKKIEQYPGKALLVTSLDKLPQH